ncbi:MAG TPA: MFS transporter [Cytophagales bacterium]|nr:MFS transporter [Cytophagales bacterium]HCR54313.1 MFS transporter [Cytophagales bacterium]
MSVSSMVVFVGGLIGTKIAPVEKLATLPIACMVIGTATAVVPVTFIMKTIGRKKSFLLILTYSIVISFLCAYAIYLQAFYFFCVCTFLFGATNACVMQFRFAAMESVAPELIPNAASSVLLGGIAAAFIGPEAAVFGKDLFSTEFLGSFLLLALLFAIAILVLLGFRNPQFELEKFKTAPRSLKTISKQPVFWVAILSAAVGYMVMSFIMTATPVSMHVMDGHSIGHTKWVIQSHIVAMYLPSMIAAWIVNRLGVNKMMIYGLIAYLICIMIAYSGHYLANYWVSLILLGIGWNFLFIGGTTLLPQSYQTNERFKVQAFNEFVVFGTQAIAALSAGWIVYSVGWETMLLFTLPIIFFQFIIVLRWAYRKPADLTV